MNLKLYVLLIMAIIGKINFSYAQQVLQGFVVEKKSDEKIIDASILAPYLKKGTASNNYGYFSLNLPKDTATIIISHIGYTPIQYYWEKSKNDTVIKFELSKIKSVDEVTVVASKIQKNVESSQMSKITVSIEQIKAMPKFLGETDVLKSLQMLPGVSQGTEGTSGVIVRGGTPDQNLILLDGTPVYNASHLFGIFSTFNADAIRNVELYKGGFPARFGGRLSSVIDISLKDGNKNELHGEGGIGMLASKLMLEGPLKKGKSSFMISARRSYADILAQPFLAAIKDESGIDKLFAYFYDLNAKLNFNLSKKDNLYLSLYTGDDRLNVKIKEKELTSTFKIGMDIGWGNKISTVRWNHIFSKKLFANTTLNYTQYRFQTKLSEEETTATNFTSFNAKYKSGIYDVGAKIDFDYRPNYSNNIKFGVAMLQHTFTPGASTFKIIDPGSPVIDTAFNVQKQNSIELSTYIEDDIALTNNFKLNAGLHFGGFKAKTKFYPNVQPRLSCRYLLGKSSSLKASYTRMYQYIHLLTNNGTTLPTDLWVPSTDKIKPMQSDQFAMGFSKNIKNKYEFTIEAYYKTMFGVIEYKDGAGFLNSNSDNWDVKVDQGKGKSYGIEFLIQKTSGRTTGWIGYTLNWANRTFDQINNGKTFWYKYDRRHDVELTIAHKLSKHWDISANFVFQSAMPFTLPVAQFQGTNNTSPNQPYFYGFSSGTTFDILDGRNGFRLLPYHRMDGGFTYHKQKKRYEKTWNFSFYNIYNRLNPFLYQINKSTATGKTQLDGYPLLPFLPSISYGFKF
jgi:hypothetical protein